MERFLQKHADKVTGVLSCFDRVLFKGHLPICSPGGMATLLDRHGVLIKDLRAFVQHHSGRIKEHARAMCQRAGRPYVHVCRRQRKEHLVETILRRHPVTEGLVCVLAAVEGCTSFRVGHDRKHVRPQLRCERRKCLCLYYYFLDPDFGLLHVRLQSWFPLTIQVCLNGHHWLARQMDRAGIAYRQVDNAFVYLGDPQRAQALADRFARLRWPRILGQLARRVCPLFEDLLKAMEYYWVSEQAEYATDVLFRGRASLCDLYENLLRHATLCFRAEDVMRFLGRKLHGCFAGDIVQQAKRRWPGARIRHRMKGNWIKMYDKHGVILRVETVINHPYEFRVRRRGVRKGREVVDWFPLPKGVCHLWRYAQVSLRANCRYLQALAEVEDPTEARRDLRRLTTAKKWRSRRLRGLHPLDASDGALFQAVLAGEHAINGFTNRDIRQRLFGTPSRDGAERRRQSARVTRKLQLLRAHGLIRKIPRRHLYRPTDRGLRCMAAAIYLREAEFPNILQPTAA